MGARTLSVAEANDARCWFTVDRVPRDAEETAWKRWARLRQAQWRKLQGFPIGSEPYASGPGSTPVGSRIELAFAKERGANSLTEGALLGACARLLPQSREPHELLDEQRLWAAPLSSMPMCFNLFGDLGRDREAARRMIDAWGPDAPGGDVSVRFEHSPGRMDLSYLGNKSAFDVAFELDAGAGRRAILGVETKYHEHAKVERAPRPEALSRYVEVSERSGVFAEGWRATLIGSDLQQIWLDQVLVLSMLQHPTAPRAWDRFVLIYPAGNPSIHSAAQRYRALLRDDATLERRLATAARRGAEVPGFRERYLGL